MSPTIVCSGTAGLEFVCMNAANISTRAICSMDLAGLILSNPLFSTEDDHIYFAEDLGVISLLTLKPVTSTLKSLQGFHLSPALP